MQNALRKCRSTWIRGIAWVLYSLHQPQYDRGGQNIGVLYFEIPNDGILQHGGRQSLAECSQRSTVDSRHRKRGKLRSHCVQRVKHTRDGKHDLNRICDDRLRIRSLCVLGQCVLIGRQLSKGSGESRQCAVERSGDDAGRQLQSELRPILDGIVSAEK